MPRQVREKEPVFGKFEKLIDLLLVAVAQDQIDECQLHQWRIGLENRTHEFFAN